MSHAADTVASKETPDAPGCGESSPPPYSDNEQQPPPYCAAPPLYPQPKAETTCVYAPADGYESFRDAEGPETSADTLPLASSSSFDDRTVRRAFVRKVFSILILQLLFTFAVVCVFTFSSAVKAAVQSHLWVYISAFVVFFVVVTALNCCKSLRQRHPWNLIGLAVVTLSFSYMVGTVASFHDTRSVVITMATTLVISLVVIAFATQTRYDFTICYGVLLILAVDLLMFGVYSTFYFSHISEVTYGCLGALIYSLFLVVDCQLLMGKMSYRLDPEDYISAALIIYMDIVLIFLYLLGRR